MSKVTLIPVDLVQCQAEKQHGTFMSFGPVKFVRCKRKAVFVATENKPAADGAIGSMSLCEECAEVAKAQFGKDYMTMAPIKPGKAQAGNKQVP